jgi:hypothetical protein
MYDLVPAEVKNVEKIKECELDSGRQKEPTKPATSAALSYLPQLIMIS